MKLLLTELFIQVTRIISLKFEFAGTVKAKIKVTYY